MVPDLEPAVTLPWLIRLRWMLIAGQLVVLPVARWIFNATLTWWLFALVLVLAAVSNVVLTAVVHRTRWTPAQLMGGTLVLDTALLTVQLAALGGATNPFTVFYLVYITLSAVVLSARWTTMIASLAILGFGALFLIPAEMHVHASGPAFKNPHLQGMWAAFVLAAALIAFFIRRISRAIAAQREEIATLRENGARNARLASLATLAAGAAHELNSPLSTIAVAAHEAVLRVRRDQGGDGAVAKDLDLILAEVDRCQEILHQMSARATRAETTEPVSLEELIGRLRAQLGEERARRLDLRVVADGLGRVVVPSAQLVQSVYALVKNALEASAPDQHVAVELRHEAHVLSVTIEDQGSGIRPELLPNVGEPFFTTKAPGEGLGLGVFLARAFFESGGGALAITPRPGGGMAATARWPVAEEAS